MSKQVIYNHWVRRIKDKIQLVFDRPDMWELELFNMNPEKRYRITIEEEQLKKTPSQLGYLWGAIYGRECADSNEFFGRTKKEIHQHLFGELEEYVKVYIDKDGNEKSRNFVPDIRDYSKDEIGKYIDKLIPHLAVNYGIEVKSPEEYKLTKYEQRI